jgi:hypothetical protein
MAKPKPGLAEGISLATKPCGPEAFDPSTHDILFISFPSCLLLGAERKLLTQANLGLWASGRAV